MSGLAVSAETVDKYVTEYMLVIVVCIRIRCISYLSTWKTNLLAFAYRLGISLVCQRTILLAECRAPTTFGHRVVSLTIYSRRLTLSLIY